MTWKIIWTDNFDRETVDEKLVCDNIKTETEGKIMLEALRERCTPSGPDWYKLVSSDYELRRF